MVKWDLDKIAQVKNLYKSGISMNEVGSQLGVSVWSIRSLMLRQNIIRRPSNQTNHLRYVNSPLSYHLKTILTLEDQLLKTGGLMLYWGEGAKKNTRTIDFANSDPEMIAYFIQFFRTIYQPQEDKFRVLLYTYHLTNISEQITYWSNLTQIPPSQFSKPYIKTTSQQKHDKMPHGLIHIRYSDKRLFKQLMQDLDQVKC
ncbi:MAG: hypothetical protein WCL07_03620 [bacterium]